MLSALSCAELLVAVEEPSSSAGSSRGDNKGCSESGPDATASLGGCESAVNNAEDQQASSFASVCSSEPAGAVEAEVFKSSVPRLFVAGKIAKASGRPLPSCSCTGLSS